MFSNLEELEELEDGINLLKKRLIEIAKETGLNSPETLYYSQRLDKLIVVYQKMKIQKVEQKSFALI